MTIPKSKYRKESGIRFVTMELLRRFHSEEEVKAFDEWFCGQTGMVSDDGTLAIYIHDYERWVSQGKMTQQRSDDWD